MKEHHRTYLLGALLSWLRYKAEASGMNNQKAGFNPSSDV